MKSSTLIGLGSNNVPVVEITGIGSSDVRDKLTKQFIEQVMETRLVYVHIPDTPPGEFNTFNSFTKEFGVEMITLYPLGKDDDGKDYPSGFPVSSVELITSIRKLIHPYKNDITNNHLIEEAISCVLSVYVALGTVYDKNLMSISYGQEALTISLPEIKNIKWISDRIVYDIPMLVSLLEDCSDAHKLAEKISMDIHNFMFINNIQPKIPLADKGLLLINGKETVLFEKSYDIKKKFTIIKLNGDVREKATRTNLEFTNLMKKLADKTGHIREFNGHMELFNKEQVDSIYDSMKTIMTNILGIESEPGLLHMFEYYRNLRQEQSNSGKEHGGK